MTKRKQAFIAAAAAAGTLACLRCRGVHPLRAEMDRCVFAHRGFHCMPEAPENSREAFRRAAARGFGAELDVHLLADGGLAVMHDSNLARTTGEEGQLEQLTVPQLADYHLLGNGETIPTLREVLDIYNGAAPLIIELKACGGNAAALSAAVCKCLDGYRGFYGIESFDPRAVQWLKQHRPDILRGQLSENFLKTKNTLSRPLAFVGTNLLCNLFAEPDFIAYRYADRKSPANVICLNLWNAAGASWTLRSPEEFHTALSEGLWPIFEGFDPDTGELLPDRL